MMEDSSYPPVEDIKLEEAQGDLPTVEQAHADAALSGTTHRRRNWMLYGSIGGFVIILVIILGVTLPRQGSGGSGTANVRDHAQFDSVKQYIQETYYDNDGTVFETDDTPQMKALEFLLLKDKLEDLAFPEETSFAAYPFMQRYATMVFVYSLMPEEVQDVLVNPETSECDWMAEFDAVDASTFSGTHSTRRLGFFCHERSVTGIRMPGLNLEGTLPVHEMQRIMTSLHVLELDVNQINGEIPVIDSLRHLSLSYNDLDGAEMPINMGDMTSLRILSLTGNGIKGDIPPSISNLQELRIAALDDNELEGGLHSLMSCAKLEEVYLNHNSFFGTLSHATFESTPNLKIWNIERNNFHGPVPNSVFKLKNLVYANFHRNSLDQTWEEESLDSSYDGTIEYFDIGRNLLYGSVPKSIQFLGEKLTHLDISENRFGEPLSQTEMGALLKLKVLLLNDNSYLGPQPIPDWLRNMADLQVLSLQYTSRTGEIPPFLGTLDNLEFLDLSHNELSGNIPQRLSKLDKLRFLELDHNNLVGKVPDPVSSMEKLLWFSVSQNSLTGTVGPSDASSCPMDVLVADCGNPADGCPNGDNCAAGGFQEVSCPCCTQCCYDSLENEACNAGNNLHLLKQTNDAWKEIRLLRPSLDTLYVYYSQRTKFQRRE